MKQVVSTPAAPAAIGPYSQAIRVGDTVWLSGQIPLDPATGELVEGGFQAQARRMFQNLQAVAEAAGGTLSDVVKVNLYLTDLAEFAQVNALMKEFFQEPYPARAAVQVSALPRGALVEAEAVMVTGARAG